MNYTITCKQCNGTAKVNIKDDQFIEYIDTMPIISARKRPDLKWGFECGECGNDSRVCRLESSNLAAIVKGDATAIERIKSSLEIPDDDKFIMREL